MDGRAAEGREVAIGCVGVGPWMWKAFLLMERMKTAYEGFTSAGEGKMWRTLLFEGRCATCLSIIIFNDKRLNDGQLPRHTSYQTLATPRDELDIDSSTDSIQRELRTLSRNLQAKRLDSGAYKHCSNYAFNRFMSILIAR